MQRKSEMVAFRLSYELLPLLDEARKGTSMSRGDMCRVLVTGHLMQGSLSELEAKVACMDENLRSLRVAVHGIRAAVSRLLYLSLLERGVDREEAKARVRQLLKEGT